MKTKGAPGGAPSLFKLSVRGDLSSRPSRAGVDMPDALSRSSLPRPRRDETKTGDARLTVD